MNYSLRRFLIFLIFTCQSDSETFQGKFSWIVELKRFADLQRKIRKCGTWQRKWKSKISHWKMFYELFIDPCVGRQRILALLVFVVSVVWFCVQQKSRDNFKNQLAFWCNCAKKSRGSAHFEKVWQRRTFLFVDLRKFFS